MISVAKHILSIVILLIIITTIISCRSKEASKDGSQSTKNDNTQEKEGSTSLPLRLLGNYHGVQTGHVMQDKWGDDAVISEQNIPVPSVDHKILFQENNAVSMKLTNLKDNQIDRSEGTYEIVSEDSNGITIKFSVTNNSDYSWSGTIVFNKADNTAKYIGSNGGLDFNLTKTDSNS